MSKKTNKALKKRLKTTKNGKVKARRGGNNHFNTKMSGEDKQKKKRMQDFDLKQKDKDRFLPHS